MFIAVMAKLSLKLLIVGFIHMALNITVFNDRRFDPVVARVRNASAIVYASNGNFSPSGTPILKVFSDMDTMV